MSDDKPPTWKDHPVVIAALSCAAGIAFAHQFIFPAMTASLQNEIADLKKQVSDAGISKERIKSLEEKLKKSEADAASAQAANMFSLQNPYPMGLGALKLGDSLDAIERSFPGAEIEKKSGYWSVKNPTSQYSDATYFFDRRAQNKRVRSIMFFLKANAPNRFLQSKLTDALGQPTISGPKADCYIWKVNDTTFVKNENSRAFNIESSQPKCENDE
ncbi:hypothetical protein V1291_004779 [Nitrobacteraceae bacterium AZCC 1564]